MPALQFSLPTPHESRELRVPTADFHGLALALQCCETRALISAHSPHSDRELIVRLGSMPVDLAAPLLRSSLPTLDATALLALIATTGEAHHILIAQRPDLDGRVVRALLRSGHDPVLIALALNQGIKLDADDRAALERLANDRPALGDALTRRFGPCREAADDSHSNLKLLKLIRGRDCAKFCQEAAKRLQIDAQNLHRILQKSSAVPLALTVCALGLDRAVFLYFLPMWQAANQGQPPVDDHHRPLILSVFAMAPQAARSKLLAVLNP